MADLQRGDFKWSQYGRIILPFTLLRRLECVMEPTKAAVLDDAQAHHANPRRCATSCTSPTASPTVSNATKR
ncbi:type I restriction-modification system subunit M N-terminal domain-containing protein [Halomonas sp. YLB-10]|uniref:type I restriction-modification system subunit M N-terminal domain-containing protein n=1 Tax=Halomonas sp. YLB-10 TaxID=2483111 RepID=UPI003908B713